MTARDPIQFQTKRILDLARKHEDVIAVSIHESERNTTYCIFTHDDDPDDSPLYDAVSEMSMEMSGDSEESVLLVTIYISPNGQLEEQFTYQDERIIWEKGSENI